MSASPGPRYCDALRDACSHERMDARAAWARSLFADGLGGRRDEFRFAGGKRREFLRDGFSRLGVSGALTIRLRVVRWILGIAGVAAARFAMGARSCCTSSSSSLSSVFPSDMLDIFPADVEAKEEEAVDLLICWRWRLARGDGESLEGVMGEPLRGVDPVFVLSCAERVSAAFRADDLGVLGVAELDADGGRGKFFVVDVFVVFMSFVGRVGEPFLGIVGDDGGFNFEGVEGVAGGVAFTADDDFNAARCGRGLIGLVFRSTDGDAWGLRCSFPPSSDEEVLRRRRAPALAGAGEGGFIVSAAMALERSLGSADAAGGFALLGRRDDPLVGAGPVGVALLSGLFAISSVEERLCWPETRLRVIGFASGVFSRLLGFARGRLSPPIEARGAEACCGVTERRLEDSFDFLAILCSSVLLWLLRTPAIIAFPTEARFKDWRRELRVVGFDGALGLPPCCSLAGMSDI